MDSGSIYLGSNPSLPAMSVNEMEKIKAKFLRLDLHPTYLEHEAVITSAEAAKTRGFELRQGIKALLFTDKKDNFVIVNVPGDRQVDQNKVAVKMAWSKNSIRLATAEKAEEITGCQIGSVPPFGHRTSIPILFDNTVFDNTISTFNIGLRTHSVKIQTNEMRILFAEIGALEGDFIK